MHSKSLTVRTHNALSSQTGQLKTESVVSSVFTNRETLSARSDSQAPTFWSQELFSTEKNVDISS